MLAIIFITYALSVASKLERLVSTTIKDNKLIALYQPYELNNTRVRVFELKDGRIADIFNNGKTFDFGHVDKGFALVELDTPDELKENKNKLWIRFDYQGLDYNLTTSSSTNSVGYINLNDMTLENGSSFIKFPTHENFPVKGYTTNSIKNELGSNLYVTGGEIYNNLARSYSVSNLFYKYSFASKEWVDMTYTVNGRLEPLTEHKSVVIDSRYLVILGGKVKNRYNSMSINNDHSRQILEFNSLYNLTIFDTVTNNWENINIKPNIFDTNIASIQFLDFLVTVYKDKIIVLGGYIGEQGSNLFRTNEYLGILDFNSKSWNWSPIINEDGSSYKLGAIDRSIQLLNDQFIICTDLFEGGTDIPIHVFDITSHKISSTLRFSNSLNSANSINDKNGSQNQSKSLPAYAIVLIAVGCTMLFAGLLYLSYFKIRKIAASKNEKIEYNESILEIWSNPEVDNTVVEFGRDGNLY